MMTVRRAVHLFAVAMILCPSMPAQGQGAADKGKPGSLAKVVKLPQGTIRLGDVVKALSEQTGAKISVASYLEDRRVILAVDGLTAGQVLDSLAMVHELTLRETGDNSYMLARRAVRPAASASDLPAAMRKALPPDIRRFLGITPTTVDSDRERFRVMPTLGGHEEMMNSAQQDLFDAVKPDLLTQDSLEFDRMTPSQQQKLLFLLFFQPLRDTMDLLYGAPMFHTMRAESTSLRLDHGKILAVTGPLSTGGPAFFGKNIVNP